MTSTTMKTGWTRTTFGDVVKLCRDRSNDPASDGFPEALIRLNPEIAARPDCADRFDRVVAKEVRDVFYHG